MGRDLAYNQGWSSMSQTGTHCVLAQFLGNVWIYRWSCCEWDRKIRQHIHTYVEVNIYPNGHVVCSSVCVCVDLNYKCCRICLWVVSAHANITCLVFGQQLVMRVKKDASFCRYSWLPLLLLLLHGHLVVLFWSVPVSGPTNKYDRNETAQKFPHNHTLCTPKEPHIRTHNTHTTYIYTEMEIATFSHMHTYTYTRPLGHTH